MPIIIRDHHPDVNSTSHHADLVARLHCLYNQARHAEALAAAKDWLAAHPEDAVVLSIAAGFAKLLDDGATAETFWRRALKVAPEFAEAHFNLGVLYADSGRLPESAAAYRRAIALQPAMADGWRNLGIVLSRLGQGIEAEAACREALRLRPADPEDHYNLGVVLAAQGRSVEAEAAYRAALEFNPNHARAWNNLGILFSQAHRFAEAADIYRRAIAIAPELATLHNNLGSALLDLGDFAAAASAFGMALALDPDYAAAAANLGNALRMLQRYGEAESAYRRAITLDPDPAQALSQLVRVKRYAVAWQGLDADDAAVKRWLARGRPGAVSPFSLQVIPTLTGPDHCRASRLWAEFSFVRELALPPLVAADRDYSHARLRVGYLSADFHEHATVYLLAGVLEAHDPQRLAVYGYSYGPARDDPARRRVEAACATFRDLRELDDEAAAHQIAADEIDILVDLKGYTQDCRIGITARRPAPVIVSWLGYPGSLGHPRLADYVIGDPVVTPLEHADHFSETIAQLPHCYQPNDRARAIGQKPSRTEAGLPAQGFVFCSFNLAAKLNPEVFEIWCRLLLAVPGSVLWLLQPTAEAAANLKREASARGVVPERLVFAPKRALTEHLGRLQLADLALDTFPYGSHTTGSDALWAGVPLVTRIGDTFASRVAASLLHAAWLPELVTDSWDDYFDLALGLAQEPERLAAIRARLDRQRLSAPLFDTVRFARDLEALYRRIWQNHREGKHVPIQMSSMKDDPLSAGDALADLLRPARRTRVVDIGANPIDGTPPYQPLIEAGLCDLVGFEPQVPALEKLRKMAGPHETYLPHVVGDGQAHTLHQCRASGMTSLLPPDPATLDLFAGLLPLAEVEREAAVETVRLDDLAEVGSVDFLKIDIQGGELAVFRHGRTKLAEAVAIQTEVSFVPLYQEQPVLGDVDLELRAQGFIPHCFAAVKKWPIAPCVINNNPRQPLNQLLETDLVYVRDISRPDRMSAEQLKHLALIAHHCYGSFDLALRCVMLLERRGALEAGSQARYLDLLAKKKAPPEQPPDNAAREAAAKQ